MTGPDSARLALAHVPGLHAYTPGIQPSGPGWVKLNTNECPYPPSYSLYPVLIGIQDGASARIPMDRGMRLPVREIAASGARILFLTSPNAPTGVGFPNSEIAAVLDSFGGIVVVDEAYAPFARENCASLLAGRPNLVVVRTLSKAYALAGMRVGYALADAEVIGLIDRVRDSYNVSRLAQVAAVAALGDPDYYAGVIGRIRSTRDYYADSWRTRRGWFTYPSEANFIFTEPRDADGRSGPGIARAAYDFLFSRKVLVRHFPSDALTAPFLRISVGTDDEMLVLERNLDAWQKAPPNA